jgi:hypothetical protein
MSNAHIVSLGKGVLFQNDKKTSDKSPDYKGTITLADDYKAGQTIKLAGWIKRTPKGNLISISEDTWKPEGQVGPKEVTRQDDGDIPF